jgi:hypothetical protein
MKLHLCCGQLLYMPVSCVCIMLLELIGRPSASAKCCVGPSKAASTKRRRSSSFSRLGRPSFPTPSPSFSSSARVRAVEHCAGVGDRAARAASGREYCVTVRRMCAVCVCGCEAQSPRSSSTIPACSAARSLSPLQRLKPLAEKESLERPAGVL